MAEILTKQDKLLKELESKNIDDMKSDKVKEVKEQAGKLIKPYDWYSARKVRDDVAIPDEVKQYCKEIRKQSEIMEDEINKLDEKIEVENHTIDFGE